MEPLSVLNLFVADNIKPGVVVNLVGYKLGDNTAFVVWESPEDNDIEKFIIALGTETITVDAETTYGTIYGNLSQPLKSLCGRLLWKHF